MTPSATTTPGPTADKLPNQRELAASLALARPGSPACAPIQAQMATALAAQAAIRNRQPHRYSITCTSWSLSTDLGTAAGRLTLNAALVTDNLGYVALSDLARAL